MPYANLILPLNLRGTFTYAIPPALEGEVQPGKRVLVPFGGKKIYTGIVLNLHQEAPADLTVKEVISVLDEKPLFTEGHLKFWSWLSDYYMANLGEIYRLAVPASLKLESETYLRMKPGAQPLLENLEINEVYLLQALEVRQVLNLSEIEAFLSKKEIVPTIKSLLDMQLIEIDEQITEPYRAKEVKYVSLADEKGVLQNLPGHLQQLGRAGKQKEILLHLAEHFNENPGIPLKKSALFEAVPGAGPAFNKLKEKGLVTEHLKTQDRVEVYLGELETAPALSPAQQKALEAVNDGISKGENVLLFGVTGSGKTHIYAEKIADTLAEGKSALLLVPEVSLAKQLANRLEKMYGEQFATYHPKLSDFEKVEVWQKVLKGQVKVVIGTRNALFLPLRDLGLIIVDEEHDAAYRPKEVSPFFQGKEAALMLGKFFSAPVILGSATPSVESYAMTQKGKLTLVRLEERFGKAAPPQFYIENVREALESKTMQGDFSPISLSAIQSALEDKKQVMVLHNRRGYSSVVECNTCGFVTYCSNCDVVMTYHKNAQELKCHYCGHRENVPQQCPRCRSASLDYRGVGVEQIFEQAEAAFPNARVERMDTDSMRKKFAYEQLYERIASGETDIIVGTQMISKGLDFDNVELVVVPRADQMLYVQDFRAQERAYQLLLQTAGRAGRVSTQGKMMIQASNPDNQIFQLLEKMEVEPLYDYFLHERKNFHYPPFSKIILLELTHRREDKVHNAAAYLASLLHLSLPTECILGPSKAPIPRLNLLYYYQIMLKLPKGTTYIYYKEKVSEALREFEKMKAYQSVKVKSFVDF